MPGVGRVDVDDLAAPRKLAPALYHIHPLIAGPASCREQLFRRDVHVRHQADGALRTSSTSGSAVIRASAVVTVTPGPPFSARSSVSSRV